jgi:hypothetical protein
MNSKILMLIILAFIFINTNRQSNNLQVSVDTAITGFHYAANYSGTSVYTKNGISHLKTGNQPSAFSVTFSKMKS